MYISLVVLLAVIVGSGYIAWRWSQDQYYIGADSSGHVVIYRGINQRIAGMSLSSPFQPTEIQLAQVPSPYQQALKATDTVSSLNSARGIVATVQSAVGACRQAYLDRQAWVPKDQAFKAYQAALALANKNKQHKKPPAVANPGAEPAPAAATCPPSTAFGVPASDLAPAPGAS